MGYKSQLLMQIMAKDQSKKELVGVSRNLQRTGRVGAKAGRQVSSAWAMAARAAAAAGLAFGAAQVKQMADAGRASLAVEDAFKRLNKTAGTLIVTMRKASGGLLDDTSLQKIANKLQAIELSGAQMGEILEVSMKLAAQSGQDYLDVTQRLTQALITGETESFKTLGILVDSKQALAAYAAENGVTVESLDKTEQAQAKVNEALRQANARFGAVDTTAFQDEMKKAETAAQNLWDKLTRFTFKGVNEMAAGLLRIKANVDEFDKPFATAEARVLAFAKAMGDASASGGPFRSVQSAFDGVTESRQKMFAGGVQALDELTNRAGEFSKAMKAAGADLLVLASKQASDTAAARVEAIKKVFAALDDVQKLRIKAANSRNALDAAELDAAEKKLSFLRQSGVATAELTKQWEDARASDALGSIAERAKSIRDSFQGLANLTASDAMRSLLGLGPAKTKPKKPKKPQGPAKAERVDQLPGLEAARRAAELELFVTQNFITEKERMLAEFREREKVIAAEELTADEQRVALETLDLERKKFLLEEEARATEEAKRRQAQAEQMLADTRRANQQRMEKETARRAAAEAKATANTRRNVQGSINASNQLAHAFIENKTALNVVDGLTETARSIAAFARYDYAAGVQHAIASAAFFVAAGKGAKTNNGGGGGSFAGPSPDTAQRFDGATTPDQGQGGNVTINVHGFAGDEEKLSQEVVRLANIGGQSGFKINGDAVDESRREGF
jgi:hypothetical protein